MDSTHIADLAEVAKSVVSEVSPRLSAARKMAMAIVVETCRQFDATQDLHAFHGV